MQKILGNLNRGLFFILSAPSGAGKTTLTRMLTDEFDSVIESISFTTRKPRKEEKDGLDYFFISKEEFEKKIKTDEFLEYAKVYDDYYGTSKNFVEKKLSEKKHVVLVIDTQGAIKLKNKIDATYIFISPPSMLELQNRMTKRGDLPQKEIDKRLVWANKEMRRIYDYDYNIVNDDLKIAYLSLKSIFIAKERKVINLKNWR